MNLSSETVLGIIIAFVVLAIVVGLSPPELHADVQESFTPDDILLVRDLSFVMDPVPTAGGIYTYQYSFDVELEYRGDWKFTNQRTGRPTESIDVLALVFSKGRMFIARDAETRETSFTLSDSDRDKSLRFAGSFDSDVPPIKRKEISSSEISDFVRMEEKRIILWDLPDEDYTLELQKVDTSFSPSFSDFRVSKCFADFEFRCRNIPKWESLQSCTDDENLCRVTWNVCDSVVSLEARSVSCSDGTAEVRVTVQPLSGGSEGVVSSLIDNEYNAGDEIVVQFWRDTPCIRKASNKFDLGVCGEPLGSEKVIIKSAFVS